jgi:hypothetical protein
MEESGQLHDPAALPKATGPDTHWVGDWVCSRVVMVHMTETNFFPAPAGNRTPITQPAAQPNTPDKFIHGSQRGLSQCINLGIQIITSALVADQNKFLISTLGGGEMRNMEQRMVDWPFGMPKWVWKLQTQVGKDREWVWVSAMEWICWKVESMLLPPRIQHVPFGQFSNNF